MKRLNPNYSTTYHHAFEWILEAEGGDANHKNDRGGLTRFGISHRAYPQLDIASITYQQAYDIYYQDYWCLSGCQKIALVDNPLAIALFDAAVNHGVKRAVRILQTYLCRRSLRSHNQLSWR